MSSESTQPVPVTEAGLASGSDKPGDAIQEDHHQHHQHDNHHHGHHHQHQQHASSHAHADHLSRWAHVYSASESIFERPTRLAATVVHGFKRGSKDLGIPTANLSMDELGNRGHGMSTGIYFGYARLGSAVYETVVSVGWNPYYKNERKTIEAHLLAKMEDFYGEKIDVLLLGYLRDEMNFDSLDALISCINADIARSQQQLKELAHHTESDWAIHDV